jgi:hypothetical protein
MLINGLSDIYDSRDLLDRIEELEELGTERTSEEQSELSGLYLVWADTSEDRFEDGITFVRYSYFADYARDLADDLGLLNEKNRWPYTCIDWEKAAWELLTDYASTEIFGTTYYFE